MDSNDYESKIINLLDVDQVYKPVSYKPTARITRRIRTVVILKDVFDGDDFEPLQAEERAAAEVIWFAEGAQDGRVFKT